MGSLDQSHTAGFFLHKTRRHFVNFPMSDFYQTWSASVTSCEPQGRHLPRISAEISPVRRLLQSSWQHHSKPSVGWWHTASSCHVPQHSCRSITACCMHHHMSDCGTYRMVCSWIPTCLKPWWL